MRSNIKRWLFLVCGWVAIVLAAFGVVLPILPTTPFLLLAGFCFLNSSPYLHQKMLQHPKVGPILRDWQQSGCIKKEVKRKASILIVLSFSLSIYLLSNLYLQLMLLVVGMSVLLWVNRLPEK